MPFAILRIGKLKSQLQITQAVAHNHRLIPCSGDIGPPKVEVLHGDENASHKAKLILSNHKIRKNAVYGLEILLGASPEYFRDDPDEAGKYDFKAYESLEAQAYQWLEENFGAENIISTTGHLSESTPHFHCLMIPIDPKGKLNAQHWVGTPQKLRDLQTSWAKQVESLGLVRGKPNAASRHSPVSLYRRFAWMGLSAFRKLLSLVPSHGKAKPKEEPKKLIPDPLPDRRPRHFNPFA